MTLKLQRFDSDWGWIHATRVLPGHEARELAAYNRNWPSERHRIVRVGNDNSVEVVSIDDADLRRANEEHEIDSA